MQARTKILAVAVIGLVGVAAWQLPDWSARSDDAPETAVVPSEARASGGPTAPVVTVDDPELGETFPIMKATTPAQVRQVLRLTQGAAPEHRPALLHAALNAKDPLVAGNAVKALGRLGMFTSEPALLALTTDARLRVRQDAVTACGLDGGAEAIPHLEQALATGDDSLRPLVIQALGKIGSPAARKLVESVVADPDATNTDRVFARAALERTPGDR